MYNIVDFLKNEVAIRNNTQFNRDEFVQLLNENVPDWREQVKDKSLWPDLHTQSSYVNEKCFLDVIIEEAGLEYASYLIETQWGKRHLDASAALDYCARNIMTDLQNMPETVIDKILLFKQREFLNECLANTNLWNSLSCEKRFNFVDYICKEEMDYCWDIMLFMIWKDVLNYEDNKYIVFRSEKFSRIQKRIIATMQRNQSRGGLEENIEHLLSDWDCPSITNDGIVLDYAQSLRLQWLRNVVLAVGDTKSSNAISTVVENIKEKIERNLS